MLSICHKAEGHDFTADGDFLIVVEVTAMLRNKIIEWPYQAIVH